MKHVEHGYGYYPGGDPRKFSPDYEYNTEKEIAAWRAACEAWERGETPDPGGPHIPIADAEGRQIGHVTMAHYGLGGYEYEWDCEGDPECYECHPPAEESRP